MQYLLNKKATILFNSLTSNDSWTVGRDTCTPPAVYNLLIHQGVVEVIPPSTTIFCPTIYLALSEARKATAFAISKPSPMIPIGTWLFLFSISPCKSPPAYFSAREPIRGVCIKPGTTVFNRTPFFAYRTAVVLVNWLMAAFDAAYATWGLPI